MLTLIETNAYRCLRSVSQPLGGFHVLVGPNGSGKSTFLDVINFVRDLLRDGPDAAVKQRSSLAQELLWMKEGSCFEIAIEALLPDDKQVKRKELLYDHIRYEIRLEVVADSNIGQLLEERVILRQRSTKVQMHPNLFPEDLAPPKIISHRGRGTLTTVAKNADKNDIFRREEEDGWYTTFRLGPRKSAFGNLPDDEQGFSATTWFRDLLQEGVQIIQLNSTKLREPSPPGLGNRFKPDGSNLPSVVSALKENEPKRFKDWIRHVASAIPDVADIEVVKRPEDGFSYLWVTYRSELKVPSWLVSDGTLRLLALTLPAYISDLMGVYLIEEPENGIHPRAIRAVVESLSSVYSGQVLLATHSPIVLDLVSLEDVLCFGKTSLGATDIVMGHLHPRLKEWKAESNLGSLLVAGVLD